MCHRALFIALAPLAGLGLAFTVSPATAAGLGAECDTAADCDAGLTCEVTGGSGCACPSEGPCEPCETVEYRQCVPGPCTEDADCGDGLVCVTYETPCYDMGAPTCSSDENCDDRPEPEACEPETRSVCAPRWVLPCETASDCGAGFDCEPREVCECSGGGPTPAPEPSDPTDPSTPDGGAYDYDDGEDGDERDPPDYTEECSCTPTGENACMAQEVACDTDAECPSGWTCQHDSAPTTTDCAVPDGGDERDCVPQPEPEPEPSPGVCYPAGYWGGGGGGGGDDYELGTPTGERANDGAAAPTDPDGQTGGTQVDGTGCQGGGGSDLPAALVAFAMMALVVRRRRLI